MATFTMLMSMTIIPVARLATVSTRRGRGAAPATSGASLSRLVELAMNRHFR